MREAVFGFWSTRRIVCSSYPLACLKHFCIKAAGQLLCIKTRKVMKCVLVLFFVFLSEPIGRQKGEKHHSKEQDGSRQVDRDEHCL